MSDRAIVLASGGMDSCVAAGLARDAGNELWLLHIAYGQLTARRERRAFDEIASFYAVPDARRLVVDIAHLTMIGGSALTDSSIELPEGESPDREGIPDDRQPQQQHGRKYSYARPECLQRSICPAERTGHAPLLRAGHSSR